MLIHFKFIPLEPAAQPNHYPPDYTLKICDVFCSLTSSPRPEVIRDHFLKNGKISHFAACQILEEACKVFKAEKNLLEISSPVTSKFNLHFWVSECLELTSILVFG